MPERALKAMCKHATRAEKFLSFFHLCLQLKIRFRHFFIIRNEHKLNVRKLLLRYGGSHIETTGTTTTTTTQAKQRHERSSVTKIHCVKENNEHKRLSSFQLCIPWKESYKKSLKMIFVALCYGWEMMTNLLKK